MSRIAVGSPSMPARSQLASGVLCGLSMRAVMLATLAGCVGLPSSEHETETRMLAQLEQPTLRLLANLDANFITAALEYSDYPDTCIELHPSAQMLLDGRPLAILDRGERDGEYCTVPSVVDQLPSSRPAPGAASRIVLSDESGALAVDVDDLLVTPTLGLETDLVVGATAIVRVTESTKIERAYVVFHSDEFHAYEARADVTNDNRIQFEVPFSPGTGTLEIRLVSFKKTRGELVCIAEQVAVVDLRVTIRGR